MKVLRRVLLGGLLLLGAIGLEPRVEASCYGLKAVAYLGRETITVSTVSIGPTAATIAAAGNGGPAVLAFFDLETANIRYREDGIAPTSTVGSPVTAPNTIEVCGETQIRNFKMIRSGAADATAWARYYRKGD